MLEAPHLGDERRLGDDDGGAGGRDLLGYLGRGVGRVGRGGDGAEAGRSEESQRELYGVGRSSITTYFAPLHIFLLSSLPSG